jgi:hypothetical protein
VSAAHGSVTSQALITHTFTQDRIAPSSADPTPCARRALRERVDVGLRQRLTLALPARRRIGRFRQHWQSINFDHRIALLT